MHESLPQVPLWEALALEPRCGLPNYHQDLRRLGPMPYKLVWAVNFHEGAIGAIPACAAGAVLHPILRHETKGSTHAVE